MDSSVPPESRNIGSANLRDALILADELVTDIELSRIPLSHAALKASRLARLLNDDESRKIFQYEAGGYPTTPQGVPQEIFELGRKAGRVSQQKEKDKILEKMKTLSIEAMEAQLEAAKLRLAAAVDAPSHVSSANPQQFVYGGMSNNREREKEKAAISTMAIALSGCRSRIYSYALEKLVELKYSSIASNAFDRIRAEADDQLAIRVPETVTKFSSIYENLASENVENWANAVHSCRRILQSIADVLFPSSGEQLRNGKTIKLGPDNYVNRLMCFVEDNSNSDRFTEIVGSHLKYIGERLDSIFKASQKGSHAEISSRQEADRYVVYTYLIVRDILSIAPSADEKSAPSAEGA